MAGVGTIMAMKHRKLTFKAQHRRTHQGLAEQMAGIAQQKAGFEIIRPVANHVIAGDQIPRRRCIHAPRMDIHRHFGVQSLQRLRRAGGLVLPNPRCGMGHLALQIGKLQRIMIHEPQRADARRGQIKRQR